MEEQQADIRSYATLVIKRNLDPDTLLYSILFEIPESLYKTPGIKEAGTMV